MNVKIHELAGKEFDEAIEWYENQFEGLGIRFKRLVNGQIKKIQNHPSWFLKEEGDLFKAYIPKFPYKVLYTFNENEIIIWAIAHTHRKPRYWQNRKKS